MISTLLSFTLIIISFSKFSHQAFTFRTGFDDHALAARANPTAENDVAATHSGAIVRGGHDPNIMVPNGDIYVVPSRSILTKFSVEPFKWKFQGQLQTVSLQHEAAIEFFGGTPLVAENVKAWKEVTESYRGLSSNDQEKIRKWLQSTMFPFYNEPHQKEQRINYLWSLSQSIREPSKIWWKKSLFEATVGHQRQFIDLVDLGDVLGFSYRNDKFEINPDNLHNLANRFAEILTKRVDEAGTEHTRTQALPIELLFIDYVDEDGISMFESRMTRVMQLLLKDFGRKTENEQRQIIEKLYLFVHFVPLAARVAAEMALHPRNSRVLDSLPFIYKPTYRNFVAVLQEDMVDDESQPMIRSRKMSRIARFGHV
ncbi:hypothetical protein PCASD_18838 [Puccinia coronata f. sp. avenae]|uniref:Uncharacterized protein n=1 Tax=Puccinia coronata f. sp. avenae TaxID=200324 RepID=A0A2N5SG37_9BASI|nr:hypothetical protein PCASD_18838 [Puccinia coronata f. sp. avenae]